MPVRKGGTIIRGDNLARFWSKTKVDGECIVWTADVDRDGYGRFAVGPRGSQRHHRAHRWIWEYFNGPIPDGQVLRHKCDNPPCVAYLVHLIPGTNLQNTHDALERGRQRQVLDEALVRKIRAVRASGASVMAFARELGIPYPTVLSAATGENWKHVE